jgi:Flp pilus assembly protein TadD
VDLFRQGHFADAEAHYTEALRLNPARFDTHKNLGVLLSRQGRLAEAAAHYAEARRLNPDPASARKQVQADFALSRPINEAPAP